MRHTWTIAKRELGAYFSTPVAYVFIIVFLLLAAGFTFIMGGFFEAGQADLLAFFRWHPWLYLFLIPAISMRLWAEERRSGTIELLMTLPVTLPQVVLGKFIAAWAFAAIALVLTFPIWITVSYLGDPDHGTIVAGYAGSLLMAGGFLAIGSCVSAITKNQVIAFVVSVVICLGFVLIGFPPVVASFAWLPTSVVDTIASFSFSTHFTAIQKGVLDTRDIVFFLSLIVVFLFGNGLILELKKAD